MATLTKDPTPELLGKLDTWFKELHQFNQEMANEVARLARHTNLPESPTGTPNPPPPPRI